MAIGPAGATGSAAACAELDAEEAAFVAGLEGVIDRALRGLRPGERFVYGIHQELAPRIADCLLRRYREAGWGEARILPGATGAATLVLAPAEG
jgi:hypothetical protein